MISIVHPRAYNTSTVRLLLVGYRELLHFVLTVFCTNGVEERKGAACGVTHRRRRDILLARMEGAPSLPSFIFTRCPASFPPAAQIRVCGRFATCTTLPAKSSSSRYHSIRHRERQPLEIVNLATHRSSLHAYSIRYIFPVLSVRLPTFPEASICGSSAFVSYRAHNPIRKSRLPRPLTPRPRKTSYPVRFQTPTDRWLVP